MEFVNEKVNEYVSKRERESSRVPVLGSMHVRVCVCMRDILNIS